MIAQQFLMQLQLFSSSPRSICPSEQLRSTFRRFFDSFTAVCLTALADDSLGLSFPAPAPAHHAPQNPTRFTLQRPWTVDRGPSHSHPTNGRKLAAGCSRRGDSSWQKAQTRSSRRLCLCLYLAFTSTNQMRDFTVHIHLLLALVPFMCNRDPSLNF
jgi:hypothetical protein